MQSTAPGIIAPPPLLEPSTRKKRKKNAFPVARPSTFIKEPINAFPIHLLPNDPSKPSNFFIRFLEIHGSEDPMYNEAVQNVLSSRIDLTFEPKRILKALAQTFDEDQKGASTSFDEIDRQILEEQVGLWA